MHRLKHRDKWIRTKMGRNEGGTDGLNNSRKDGQTEKHNDGLRNKPMDKKTDRPKKKKKLIERKTD